ncbi:hypothetical protein GBA52_028423 [Prunus armeniaca]|nr:hypothetical protein GBA52_028423 [Prunus armeniaca]
MASHLNSDDTVPPINATAVAVDKDNKNSNHAVRFAIDHLVANNANPYIILIHVRHKNHHPHQSDGESGNHDGHHVFVPYRAYCARKEAQVKEVILDDHDVAKALFGFKIGYDVPTSLVKLAPEFCSVYVISKGKMVVGRTAKRPVVNTATPPKQPSPQGLPPCIPTEQTEADNGARSRGQPAVRGGWNSAGGSEKIPVARERTRCSVNLSMDIDIPNHGSSSGHHKPRVRFLQCIMFSQGVIRQSARDIEAEMKRLKLELKQTMDMYSSACKEAISAKNKAKELNQWKQEEARKFEEARHAEEAALAIAEMEKAKCKAAIEAAEASQRVAEMEAQRRRQAEMRAKKETQEKNRALNALAHNDVRYRKYTIEEIEQATQEFSASNKIGEGGYGPVYKKGKLDHTRLRLRC